VRTRNWLTVGFIAVCTVLYLLLGKAPQTLLIFAGAFNGLILPIGFAVVLWAGWRRRDLLQGYTYPRWLLVIGAVVLVITIYMGARSLSSLTALWS